LLAVWLLAGLLMLPLAVVEHAFRIWTPIVLAVLGGIVLLRRRLHGRLRRRAPEVHERLLPRHA
jgi:hypothetical protein